MANHKFNVEKSLHHRLERISSFFFSLDFHKISKLFSDFEFQSESASMHVTPSDLRSRPRDYFFMKKVLLTLEIARRQEEMGKPLKHLVPFHYRKMHKMMNG